MYLFFGELQFKINFIKKKLEHKFISIYAESCGVYVITTFQGKVLYIGKSKNIKQRMKQHLKSNKTQTTPVGAAFWVNYITCNEHMAYSLEKGLISTYILNEGKLPYHNKIQPPI